MWATKFWEGYDAKKHEAICLDGFDGSWMPFQEIEALLDGYAYRVPIKGTSTWGRFTTVFITSNLKPQDWYPNVFKGDTGKLLYAALVGRVSLYKWLDVPYECPHTRNKRYVLVFVVSRSWGNTGLRRPQLGHVITLIVDASGMGSGVY